MNKGIVGTVAQCTIVVGNGLPEQFVATGAYCTWRYPPLHWREGADPAVTPYPIVHATLWSYVVLLPEGECDAPDGDVTTQ